MWINEWALPNNLSIKQGVAQWQLHGEKCIMASYVSLALMNKCA